MRIRNATHQLDDGDYMPPELIALLKPYHSIKVDGWRTLRKFHLNFFQFHEHLQKEKNTIKIELESYDYLVFFGSSLY